MRQEQVALELRSIVFLQRLIIFTEDDIRRRLDPAQLIAAIEEAFRSRYATVAMPLRTQISVANGTFLLMPCYDRERSALGMKLVMVTQSRAQQKVSSTYILLDPETGTPKRSFPANYLTELRTAAVSAVATKFLARDDAKVLGVFGTGRQARGHLRVLRRIRNFVRFLVCGRDRVRSGEFAQQLTTELGVRIEAVDLRTCAAESDVLCTCTTSNTPVFDGHLLRRGTHINAVGAFQAHTRELDDVTVQNSKVVVDTYQGALVEAGDLLIPLGRKLIIREHILAELHEVVTGAKAVRTSYDDITLFKSLGCAMEDLVAAELFEERMR